MNSQFFKNPILNSPYKYPDRHWELDDDGQPTQKIIERRRRAEFISPIPKPKKRGGKAEQQRLVFDEGKGLSTREQQYAQHAEIINSVRGEVDDWRRQPDPNRWRVTPETQRLLQHWRHHRFGDIRPFFCQVEAVETVIWLTEVAPQLRNTGRRFLQYLDDASQEANPGLRRLALKLATGAGKTMVMAMLIAWQTINSVRRPQSGRFTRGFLIVTPGLTIKDRLRVLKPNDPDSYYRDRELVPVDLLSALDRAKIVVINYHALRRRERVEIAKGGRALLQGRGLPLDTRESEGQMLQRVMPELMGMKNILVLNDEAHHCYREKPGDGDEGDLKGDEKKEAEKNREAARLWISGIEAVSRKLGTSRVDGDPLGTRGEPARRLRPLGIRRIQRRLHDAGGIRAEKQPPQRVRARGEGFPGGSPGGSGAELDPGRRQHAGPRVHPTQELNPVQVAYERREGSAEAFRFRRGRYGY